MDADPSSYLQLAALLKPFDVSVLFYLVAFFLLLVCSALVSGAEVAFFSLNPTDLDKLKDDSNAKNKELIGLLNRPKRLLATILIANNFINVGIVIISTYILDGLFDFEGKETLGFIIQVVVVTTLILLMGEVLPKVYANTNALSFASFMTRPISVLKRIFRPLSYLLVSSTNFIDKRVKKKGHNISVNDLSQALELTSDDTTNEDEQKILEGIVRFGNTDVKQIMKPRMDVVCIDYTLPYNEVLSTILDSGYSRIPIYEDNLDNVKGILYIKDLLPHLDAKDSFKWLELLRTPFFVPENKKINELLKDFQEKKIHMAVVVDEYGGTSGVITLEDVLEEIVGDISDEFDDEDIIYSKIDDSNYVFEGKTPLKDFYRIIDIDGEEFEESKGDADTLAGFTIEIAGKIPTKNEEITFENYTLKVEAADKRRIQQIKVTIAEIEDENDENTDENNN